jgi:hypothetical protein
MDTVELCALVNKAREIAWDFGGGNSSGDMSAIVPLLQTALKDTKSQDIQKAILAYERPKKS